MNYPILDGGSFVASFDQKNIELLRWSAATMPPYEGASGTAQAEPSTTAVALMQDGIAHRPHKTDGERVQVACRVEGSLPLELFDVQLIHHVRPELRCALCFLTPVVVVCQPHLSWMPAGQECPDCKRLGKPPTGGTAVEPRGSASRLMQQLAWPAAGQVVSFDGSDS